MKLNKKIAIVPITLILIIILTFICISVLNNKDPYILCEASETKDGIKTTVTSQYNYSKDKKTIKSIDYNIILSGKMKQDQQIASKQLFENTICNKDNKPDNITCNIELPKNKVIVKTHEEIKNNESSLLGLNNLNKLTYNKFKENQDKDTECVFK